jgi:hypothetical protein
MSFYFILYSHYYYTSMPFLSTQDTNTQHPIDDVETPTVQVSPLHPSYSTPTGIAIPQVCIP